MESHPLYNAPDVPRMYRIIAIGANFLQQHAFFAREIVLQQFAVRKIQ